MAGKKPNAAFMKPLKPSEALAEIVGDKPLPPVDVHVRSALCWSY